MTSFRQASMRGIRILSAALLLTVLMAVVASAAPLWHHVTVVSVENWKYDDVLAQLTEDGDSLIVWLADTSRVVMPRSGIKALRNNKGEDITRLVFDPSIENTEQYTQALPPAPEIASEPYLRNGRFSSAFGLQFGGSAMTGAGYEGLGGNVMVQGSLRAPISHTFHLGGVYAYQRVHVSGSTGGWGDYGQNELHMFIGLQQKVRNYSHSMFMADVGVGLMRCSQVGGLHGTNLSMYGSIALVAPTSRSRGFIIEANARMVRDQGLTGKAIGVSIGFFFMQR